jgi:hypothetical protein
LALVGQVQTVGATYRQFQMLLTQTIKLNLLVAEITVLLVVLAEDAQVMRMIRPTSTYLELLEPQTRVTQVVAVYITVLIRNMLVRLVLVVAQVVLVANQPRTMAQSLEALAALGARTISLEQP